MKRYYWTMLWLAMWMGTWLSCTPAAEKVERKEADVTKVVQKIPASFPGELLLSEDYIVWTSPLSEKEQAHVLERQSGKEVGQCIRRGYRPGEFMTATYCMMPENRMLVGDLTKDQLHLYALDSLAAGRPALIGQRAEKTTEMTPLIAITPDELLTFTPEQPLPFRYKGTAFGRQLLDGDIRNWADVNKGAVAYHPEKGLLIYAPLYMNYMAAYQKKGDAFELVWEKQGKTEYYRIGKSFEPNRQRVNLYQLVLTKDYIVALQRDYQRDPVDESQIGQQQGKLPKQLFVYDYEGRLLQILDLKMPTLRIAATPDRNEVYALVANPEYGLAKVEL